MRFLTGFTDINFLVVKFQWLWIKPFLLCSRKKFLKKIVVNLSGKRRSVFFSSNFFVYT